MTEQDFTNRIDGLINDYEGGESTSKELRDGILDTLIELVSKVSPFEARVSPIFAEELEKLIDHYNKRHPDPAIAFFYGEFVSELLKLKQKL